MFKLFLRKGIFTPATIIPRGKRGERKIENEKDKDRKLILKIYNLNYISLISLYTL